MKIEGLSQQEVDELIEAGMKGVALHSFFDFGVTPPDTNVIAMPIGPACAGMTAPLHGGALASLIDVAVNCTAAGSDQFEFPATSLMTEDLHIRYFAQSSDGPISATGEIAVERLGKLQIDVTVRDRNATVLCTGTAIVRVLGVKSNQEP